MFAQVLSAPPPWPRYDTPESFSNYYWDNFVATLLPGILAEDPRSDGCRRLVADFAAAFRYTVVADVVASAFRCRGQLGDDFPRLLHLVFAYSGYCNIHVTTQGGNNFWNTPDVGYDIGDSVAKLIDGFVSRSLRPEVPSLSEIAVSSNAMIADMNREQDKIRCDVPWTDQEFVGIQERINRGWGFEPGLIQTVFGWIDQIDRRMIPSRETPGLLSSETFSMRFCGHWGHDTSRGGSRGRLFLQFPLQSDAMALRQNRYLDSQNAPQ